MKRRACEDGGAGGHYEENKDEENKDEGSEGEECKNEECEEKRSEDKEEADESLWCCLLRVLSAVRAV